jgi:hypothetical protein
MTLDLNDLNGPQRRIVRDALLDAFDFDELRQLLDDELDVRLEHIVKSSNLETMTFELIRASSRQGWTDRLIRAAQKVSRNARIASLPETLAATEALNLTAVDAAVATTRRAVAEGGLERMVRKEGFADWGLWVDRMAEIGRRICSIQYPLGVKVGGGTGFLVADDLVLTNYHVIEDHQAANGRDPAQIDCQFDFAVGSAGATTVKLHADWLVDHSRYSPFDPGDKGGLPDPDHLDYALLRLQRAAGADVVKGAKRGSILLDGTTAVSSRDDLLFIGQHPGLQPLKLGVGEVLAANGNATRIRYDANTERGSSGSPCLDMQLNVVALHHAGDPDYTKLLGDYNQGIPIARVLERMAGRGVPKFWT